MTVRSSSAGFTLIELMSVIIIVAVLMAVALPAYQNQIIRGHRAAAKAEMLEIANKQQQFLLSNRGYTDDFDGADGTIDALSYTLPDEVAARYIIFDLNTTSASNLPYFYLEFEAIGAQVDDGNLSLDSTGEKSPPEKWGR